MTTPALAENVRGKGRHYRDPRSGELVPSVTNVLGVINKPALPRWAAREVAAAAVTMKASLAGMEDAEVMDVLKGAPWRRSTRAADRGTTIHSYLEAALMGSAPSRVDGEAAEFRAAADGWLATWQPEPVQLERTVFGDGYAGTGDAWLRIGGELWLVDFKTSKAVYAEAALQLSALAAAPLMAVGDEIVEAPLVDRIAVVRIGRDGAHETRLVRDAHAQYRAFESALQLWHWTHGDAYEEQLPLLGEDKA